tara:strand:+ start:3119 stop:4198 length:1080 start_codon:yes stop_codon:yes gene_type:complete
MNQNNETTKQNDLTINDDGKLFFNPYNPNNIEINEEIIQNILFPHLKFKYKIYNIELFKRAFIHRSYCKIKNEENNIIIAPRPNNCISLKSKSNERLEFLGDGVLELITKYYLYMRFPKADEGFMTEKKIAIVKNEHIGKLASELNLQNYYIISKHAEEKKIRNNFKKLGCLFEAFLGALFLDANKMKIDDIENVQLMCGHGFQLAQLFLNSVFENFIDWNSLIENNDNFKNNFQVILQKEFKNTPSYIILNYNDYKQDENVSTIIIDPSETNVLQSNNTLILNNYVMGVYLIIGYETVTYNNIEYALIYGKDIKSFDEIHNYVQTNGKILLYFSEGSHKIKKKAEQIACENALKIIGH